MTALDHTSVLLLLSCIHSSHHSKHQKWHLEDPPPLWNWQNCYDSHDHCVSKVEKVIQHNILFSLRTLTNTNALNCDNRQCPPWTTAARAVASRHKSSATSAEKERASPVVSPAIMIRPRSAACGRHHYRVGSWYGRSHCGEPPAAGWNNDAERQRCGLWRMKFHVGHAQLDTLQHPQNLEKPKLRKKSGFKSGCDSSGCNCPQIWDSTLHTVGTLREERLSVEDKCQLYRYVRRNSTLLRGHSG